VVVGARFRPGAALSAAALMLALALPSTALAASTAGTATTPTTPTTPPPTQPGTQGSGSGPHKPSRPDVVLSNETTYTTYTIADVLGKIRVQPAAHARALATLRDQTPDGFSQTYVLLREHWVGRTAWVQLRIPMRPNGKIGWVPRRDLDQFRVVHTELVVNRAARRLTLYRNGTVIYTARVGVGKPSTPTPAGHFWITESFPSSDAAYGPWAFGTSDYSVLTDWPGGGIVGLHGTDQPQLIPGDPSHGCIRLRNSDVIRLSHLVTIGTPLWVQ
jgi:lipoprotein-anchoring transpeptidase ErfK/SrfK